MYRNNVRTQSFLVSYAVNTTTGAREVAIELDTNFKDVTGIVVHQIGTHTKYRVGLKNKDGEYIHDQAFYKQFQQLGNERFAKSAFGVPDQKLYIVTNILEQQNAVCEFEVVFQLER